MLVNLLRNQPPPKKKNWPGGPPHSTKRYNSQDFKKRLCIIDEILPNFITPKATQKKKKKKKKKKKTF